MKNKKGFTLIELLAVIVILAIIALIATPVIMNIINSSRENSATDSAKLIVKEAVLAYNSAYLNNGANPPSIDQVEAVFTADGVTIENHKAKDDFGNICTFTTTNKFSVTCENEKYESISNVKSTGEMLLAGEGASTNYEVGDTICVTLNGFTTTNDHSAEGCTSGQFLLRVANTSACTTEESKTACGTVLEFVDVITNHRMNPYTDGSTDGDGNKGGWPASEMRSYINSTIYNALPNDIKSKIINTQVVSSHGSNDAANFTSTDKLYLLSPVEIYGSSITNSYDTSIASSRQLDYYKNAGVTKTNYSGAIKKQNGSAQYWWLRSADSDEEGGFHIVLTSGYWEITGCIDPTIGVSPAFRIG